jgi:AcrR family transcriptional regulator
MPTQTFWNLPAAKRQKLIDSAVEEFASHDYAAASINRIVAGAGIAKGSLYQYFADKRDLFLFVLDLSNRQRLEFVQRETPPAADLWALLRWQMSASARAALAYPQLTRLFYRAVSSNLPFRDEIEARMQALAREHWQQFVRDGVARGALRSDIDHDLVAFVLDAVLSKLGLFVIERLGIEMAQLAASGNVELDVAALDGLFDDLIRLLRCGIGPDVPQERA